MGLISGVLGTGSEVSIKVISLEFQPILIDGEYVETAIKVLRDIFVFTNKRLIMVNKSGFSNSKVEYLTIPYSSIKKFSKECKGVSNTVGDLKLWIAGEEKPLIKSFKRDMNINEVYLILSKYVLNC